MSRDSSVIAACFREREKMEQRFTIDTPPLQVEYLWFYNAVCLYTARGRPDQLCGTGTSARHARASAATQLPGQHLTVYSLPAPVR